MESSADSEKLEVMETNEAGSDKPETASEGPDFDADSLEDCFEELVKLIVSGQLQGTLPKGFLAVMKHLPDELLIKIWSYLTVKERRCMRLVSKHFKWMWERCNENKRFVSELRLKAKDNKLVMDSSRPGWWGGPGNGHLTFNRDLASIGSALSLVNFGKTYGAAGPIVIFDEGAVDPVLVSALAAQKWKVHTVVFDGDQHGMTHELTMELLSHLTPFSQPGFSVVFQCKSLPEKIPAESMIKACKDRMEKLCVFPCSAESNPAGGYVQVTDQGLREFARIRSSIIFPFTDGVTLQGISDFIKIFSESSQNKIEPGFTRGPELCTIATEAINIDTLKNLDVPNEKLNMTTFRAENNETASPTVPTSLTSTGSLAYTDKKDNKAVVEVKLFSQLAFDERIHECGVNRHRFGFVHIGTYGSDDGSGATPDDVGAVLFHGYPENDEVYYDDDDPVDDDYDDYYDSNEDFEDADLPDEVDDLYNFT